MGFKFLLYLIRKAYFSVISLFEKPVLEVEVDTRPHFTLPQKNFKGAPKKPKSKYYKNATRHPAQHFRSTFKKKRSD